MTYEIREYVIDEFENEEKVSHVWYQVKNLDEAMAAIIKRVFGKNGPVYDGKQYWTGVHYWMRGNWGLYEVYGSNMMEFELDNIIGPSTERRYVIERAA